MDAYRHNLAHPFEYAKRSFANASGSSLQSLATATVSGVVAALIGAGVGATLYYNHVVWYLSLAAGPVVDTIVVICLATIALEQARKRTIRKTLERSYLNHHVHNALTQIIMASNITDIEKRDRYQREGVQRISEALFRVGNDAHLASLSLDVDLGGQDLNRERAKREEDWLERGA
jgi:hypothetical protein